MPIACLCIIDTEKGTVYFIIQLLVALIRLKKIIYFDLEAFMFIYYCNLLNQSLNLFLKPFLDIKLEMYST